MTTFYINLIKKLLLKSL